MPNSYRIALAATLLSLTPVGCQTDPATKQPAMAAMPGVAPSTQSSATQPAEVVAELSTIHITRPDLDELLYETYGLRMLFDIVELDLAKSTLRAQGLTLSQEEIEAERKKILVGIRGEAAESDTENLFTQFLQNEHLTRAEFDVKIVQTDAYLRKIVTSMVVGKIPEPAIHRGFEQLYGAKRQIADIELDNVRDATIARDRVRREPFQNVALDMSIDPQTKTLGGMWQPFSMRSNWAPQVIRDTAFSMDKGQISDIISASSRYHIIKVVEVIAPTIVKYEDVKDNVRKQLEDQVITMNMKTLRQELTAKAQSQLKFDDPILKAQWDALVDQQTGKIRDRESARKTLEQKAKLPATTSTTTQS